jgi:single-strand DNA-binding protein
MKKGRPLLIEGHLDLDQWEQDGQKRSKHRVTIERFTFVDGGGGSGGSYPASPPSQAQPAPPMGGPQAPPGYDEPPGEDIPF